MPKRVFKVAVSKILKTPPLTIPKNKFEVAISKKNIWFNPQLTYKSAITKLIQFGLKIKIGNLQCLIKFFENQGINSILKLL